MTQQIQEGFRQLLWILFDYSISTFRVLGVKSWNELEVVLSNHLWSRANMSYRENLVLIDRTAKFSEGWLVGSFTMQKMAGKHVNMWKKRSIGLFKPKNKVYERKISETKFPANTDFLAQELYLKVKNLSFRQFGKVLSQIWPKIRKERIKFS